MIDQSILTLAGIVFLTALLVFLVAALWFWRNERDAETRAKAAVLADAEKQVRGRITDLEMKLVALTNAVTPLSVAMQTVFIKELTHFHTPELDALLVKVDQGILPEEDEPRLCSLLEERSRDLNGRISDSERDAAVMLPMIMKRVKKDRLQMAVEVQVVSLGPPQSTPSLGEHKE
jgi:hypothetical protein